MQSDIPELNYIEPNISTNIGGEIIAKRILQQTTERDQNDKQTKKKHILFLRKKTWNQSLKGDSSEKDAILVVLL